MDSRLNQHSPLQPYKNASTSRMIKRSSILSLFLPSYQQLNHRNKAHQRGLGETFFLHSTKSEDFTSKYRFSSSSNQSDMGEAHPKATSVDFEVSTSTGSDPTISRPQHSTHSSLQPLPDPPHSAPMVIQRTDETYSRIDYTPGTPPKPASSRAFGKSRTLARKLSQKAKGSLGGDTRGSVGEKMKVFEDMVQAVEAKKGIDSSMDHGSKTTKASAFSTKPERASVDSDKMAHQTPFSTSVTTMSIDFPFSTSPAEPITPGLYNRPTHHRRSSSNSVKSGKASIKSSKRAEREWRARVAALAHPPTPPQLKSKKSRGPLPPRRTPVAQRADLSINSTDSPASDTLVTPPHGMGSGTAARSIIFNRSSETLGHYAHLSPTFGREALISDRERKVSVPHSVVSSFYFDPTGGSRVSTRPSSFAANHLLAAIPTDNASLLRHFTVVPDTSGADEEDQGDEWTAPDSGTRKASLPPFESFQLSPVTVSSSMVVRCLALPESTTKPRQAQHVKRSSVPAEPKSNSSPLLPQPNVELQVNITKDAENRYQQLPPSRNSAPASTSHATCSLTLPARDQLSEEMYPTTSIVTSSVTPLQIRTAKSSVPRTPLSPTTAFLMTAPMESIDVTKFMCAGSNTSSPEKSRIAHPYSTVPVPVNSTGSPTPPVKIARAFALQPELESVVQSNSTTLAPLEAAMTSFDPFTAPQKAKRTVKPQPRGRDTRSAVLQPRKTQPRAIALGLGVDIARVDLERQREKLKRMGIDLTPGMEDGNRPPKSGLPKLDLERWLIATSR